MLETSPMEVGDTEERGESIKRAFEDASLNSTTHASPPAKRRVETPTSVVFLNVSLIIDKSLEEAKKLVAAELKKFKISDVVASITLGRNITIRPLTPEAKTAISEAKGIFGESKRVDQATRRPCAILKGLTFEKAHEYLESGDLKEFGIVDLIGLKSHHPSHPLRTVKIVFNKYTDKTRLLAAKRITLDYFSYIVEDLGVQPVQCHKCKGYGHLMKDCVRQLVCSKCKGEHELKDCQYEFGPMCANCGGTHSAYYRGCPVYQREKDKKLALKAPSMASRVPEGFHRNFSDVVRPSQPAETTLPSESIVEQVIEREISKLKSEIVELITATKTEITSMINERALKSSEDTRNKVQAKLNKISHNICYCVFDCLKGIYPSLQLTQNDVKTISDSMSKRGLGNINKEALFEICSEGKKSTRNQNRTKQNEQNSASNSTLNISATSPSKKSNVN